MNRYLYVAALGGDEAGGFGPLSFCRYFVEAEDKPYAYEEGYILFEEDYPDKLDFFMNDFVVELGPATGGDCFYWDPVAEQYLDNEQPRDPNYF